MLDLNRSGRVLAGAAGLAVAVMASGALADGRSRPVPVELETLRRLHVTTLGRVLEDQMRPVTRGECPQISQHTNASFEGGQYVAQAGFAQGEMAATSYTLDPNLFPIRIDGMEMIFATVNATVPTTTHWSVLIYQGTPTNGTLVAEFNSDDVILPHLHMGPGTNGTNIQLSVDPNDTEQIYILDNGTATFTVAYRIDRHNQQTQDPCFTAPPTCCNAFPTTDVSGLASATGNWLFGVNCGPFGCPPNGGWSRFSNLSVGCRPTGDWVMRVHWTPTTCPTAPGACCFSTGGCISLTESQCATAGGAWSGAGTTCAGGCDAGCPADFDGSGDLTLADFVAFRNAYTAGDLAADFDDSGTLTLADFVAFRNAYTAGCP